MQFTTPDQSPQPTPRPKPEFYDVPCFSHRKRTPNRLPPTAPVKSCPPVSRIFKSPCQTTRGARTVSFLSDTHGESSNDLSSQVSSPHYNPSSSQPFFEQCFDVVCRLGEGSFGEVYKVRSKEDGRLYAIKKSRQKFRGDIDRYRKLHEVEKHEKLPPHCNCIKFYKAWEESLHLYIMAELCLMSLAEYADLHGKLPEHRVWNVLLDLTQGLKHLHDNRLCHLDVKPANIFIGQDGFTCKLGDFGLTISIDNADLHDVLEGDSRYIPKELLKGEFSTAADVFSLGISLLELACDLELPSGGQGWHCLRNGQLPDEFIAGLSPSLIQLLSVMMDPNPHKRPNVDDILSHYVLRKTALFRPLAKTSNATSNLMRTVYKSISNWFVTMFSMIFVLLRISPWQPQLQSPPTSKSVPTEATTNHYISDSDEELEVLAQSFHNQNTSWISSPDPIDYTNSPSIYRGSPVPLSLDFHDDNQLYPIIRTSSPRITNNTVRTSSPNIIRTSSPNIIRTSSPNIVKDGSGRRQYNGRSFIKSMNIGPRNLMDVSNL